MLARQGCLRPRFAAATPSLTHCACGALRKARVQFRTQKRGKNMNPDKLYQQLSDAKKTAIDYTVSCLQNKDRDAADVWENVADRIAQLMWYVRRQAEKEDGIA